jgi:DNA-binding LytR/AlgR family response regulator
MLIMDPHQNSAFNHSGFCIIEPFGHPERVSSERLKETSQSRIISLEQESLVDNPVREFKRPKNRRQPIPEKHSLPGKIKTIENGQTDIFENASALFRLFVKNGEYVYAKSSDIIMMESCDHLVKVYLSLNEKVKRTIRHNTLKDFLLQLPPDQFMRIGRFCAINVHRLSGGNYIDQSFEFDFKVSVKLKHAISHTIFNSIGK